MNGIRFEVEITIKQIHSIYIPPRLIAFFGEDGFLLRSHDESREWFPLFFLHEGRPCLSLTPPRAIGTPIRKMFLLNSKSEVWCFPHELLNILFATNQAFVQSWVTPTRMVGPSMRFAIVGLGQAFRHIKR